MLFYCLCSFPSYQIVGQQYTPDFLLSGVPRARQRAVIHASYLWGNVLLPGSVPSDERAIPEARCHPSPGLSNGIARQDLFSDLAISAEAHAANRSLRSGIRKRLPGVEAVIVPQFKDQSTAP